MNKLSMLCLCAAPFLSACVEPSAGPTQAVASAPEQAEPAASAEAVATPDPVVATDYRGGQLSWSGGGGILYRYAAIERDGEIAICGAYARKGGADLSRLSREAMRQATVVLNGDTVMRNMSYFTPASSANWNRNLVGVETNCRSTGLAAGSAPLNAFQFNMRSGNYSIRL